MFYLAEAFLDTEGLQFSKHKAVISAFGRDFANTDRVPPRTAFVDHRGTGLEALSGL